MSVALNDITVDSRNNSPLAVPAANCPDEPMGEIAVTQTDSACALVAESSAQTLLANWVVETSSKQQRTHRYLAIEFWRVIVFSRHSEEGLRGWKP